MSEPCDECGVDTVALLNERDQLRADNERLRKEVETGRKLLSELTATVRGECPSLLNGEDASDNLAIDIDQWLEETK